MRRLSTRLFCKTAIFLSNSNAVFWEFWNFWESSTLLNKKPPSIAKTLRLFFQKYLYFECSFLSMSHQSHVTYESCHTWVMSHMSHVSPESCQERRKKECHVTHELCAEFQKNCLFILVDFQVVHLCQCFWKYCPKSQYLPKCKSQISRYLAVQIQITNLFWIRFVPRKLSLPLWRFLGG